MNKKELHNYIEKHSQELGFVDYGAIKIELLTEERRKVESYLSASYNGTMHYLERNLDIREDPSLLLEGAKSIMLFLVPYKSNFDQNGELPKISSYAYGQDYHIFVKERLRELAERVKRIIPTMEYRVFTDSAPIFERALGRMAGLGFIGKNSFLISKKSGLHTIIGVIISNLELLYNERTVKEGCGDCRRCIDACPTGAIVKPYTIDSRRCISYQTIESKLFTEPVSIEREGYIFGCEICLDVCPWSSRGEPTTWAEFLPLTLSNGKVVTSLTKEEWLEMDSEFFRLNFSKSPLKRAGLAKMKDNVKKI